MAADGLLFAGITRRSLVDRAREAAATVGKTFETTFDEARVLYVVNGWTMTPGEAAELLDIPVQV